MDILKNYEDKYTKAHKRLKNMYKYNYNNNFNDETDLKTNEESKRLMYEDRKRYDKEKE